MLYHMCMAAIMQKWKKRRDNNSTEYVTFVMEHPERTKMLSIHN